MARERPRLSAKLPSTIELRRAARREEEPAADHSGHVHEPDLRIELDHWTVTLPGTTGSGSRFGPIHR